MNDRKPCRTDPMISLFTASDETRYVVIASTGTPFDESNNFAPPRSDGRCAIWFNGPSGIRMIIDDILCKDSVDWIKDWLDQYPKDQMR